MSTNIFEPIWPTVFFSQPRFSCIELSRGTAVAFGRRWAVVVWDVVVANVSEPVLASTLVNEAGYGWGYCDIPVYLVGIFEQSQSNRMDWSITPSFVEKATRTVEMVEIIFIGLASEEVEIGDFEIGPKMTG